MSKKKISITASDIDTKYGTVRLCSYEHMRYVIWRGNMVAKANISMGDTDINESNVDKYLKSFIQENPQFDAPYMGTYALVLSTRGALDDEISFLQATLTDIFGASEEDLEECIEEFTNSGSIIVDYGFTMEVLITILSLIEIGMDSVGIQLNKYYLPYEQMMSEEVLMQSLVKDFDLK